jgi:hypothetical protein
MRCSVVTGFVLAFSLIAITPTANAQTIVGRLSTLLTEQRPSGLFVPDPAAADATLTTVAGLFSIELTNLPVAASAGGFVYQFRRDLGLYERASNEFGPFFTERTRRNGRGQTSVGFSYQTTSFGSLQGADLTVGTFPTNAARNTGTVDPFSVDTLTLELTARSVTPFVTYGVTDKLAVGAVVPFATVRVKGTRMRTVSGLESLQSVQAGSATGLGDIVINGRYLVAGSGGRAMSIGSDLRLPTGRQEDLLGTADAALRFLGVGSWEEETLAVHVNGGVSVGGISREVFWNSAFTMAATSRLTLIGELMGRYVTELGHVRDVYQPHPVLQGVETMRWLPADRGIHTLFVVTGAKWNVARSWLLNANLLMRATDAGLRDAVTPGISIDYTFER